MIDFPNHKIILEMGEDNENCLNRIEVEFNCQIRIDELLNRVIRPILIGLTYTNETISEAFNMNECGESLDEIESEKARVLRKDYSDEIEADIKEEDDIIGHDVSGSESVNNCNYDTDEL